MCRNVKVCLSDRLTVRGREGTGKRYVVHTVERGYLQYVHSSKKQGGTRRLRIRIGGSGSESGSDKE